MLFKSIIALGLVGFLCALSMDPSGASACPAGDARADFMRLEAALAKNAPSEPTEAKGLRDLAQTQISDRDYEAASRTIDRAMQLLGVRKAADADAAAAPEDHRPLSRC